MLQLVRRCSNFRAIYNLVVVLLKSLEFLLGRNRSALGALAEPWRSDLEAIEDTCPFGALPQGGEALVALKLTSCQPSSASSYCVHCIVSAAVRLARWLWREVQVCSDEAFGSCSFLIRFLFGPFPQRNRA